MLLTVVIVSLLVLSSLIFLMLLSFSSNLSFIHFVDSFSADSRTSSHLNW